MFKDSGVFHNVGNFKYVVVLHPLVVNSISDTAAANGQKVFLCEIRIMRGTLGSRAESYYHVIGTHVMKVQLPW